MKITYITIPLVILFIFISYCLMLFPNRSLHKTWKNWIGETQNEVIDHQASSEAQLKSESEIVYLDQIASEIVDPITLTAQKAEYVASDMDSSSSPQL